MNDRCRSRSSEITKRILVSFALAAMITGSIAGPVIAEQTSISKSMEASTDIDTIQAQAWIVIDRDDGSMIKGKEIDLPVYPASTTKIMTAILALEHLDLNETLVVSETAVKLVPGSSKIGFDAGEEVVVSDLLASLMIGSGNDSANVIAEAIDGNLELFADRMNQKAKELGMHGTCFRNPSGLHDDEHVTTVRDLAILADYAMNLDPFRSLVQQPLHVMPSTNKHPFVGWSLLINTNRLLLFGKMAFNSEYIVDYTGIKTGSTPYAGHCLVASAKLIDGRELISVLVGVPAQNEEGNTFSYTRILMHEAAHMTVHSDVSPTPIQQTETSTCTQETTPATTEKTSESDQANQTTVPATDPTTQVSDPGPSSDPSNESSGFIAFIVADPWRSACLFLAIVLSGTWISCACASRRRQKNEKKHTSAIRPRRVDPR